MCFPRVGEGFEGERNFYNKLNENYSAFMIRKNLR